MKVEGVAVRRLFLYSASGGNDASRRRATEQREPVSVCNALRVKARGLSFRGKGAVFPPVPGRAALCRRLAFIFSEIKRSRAPPLGGALSEKSSER